MFYLEQKSERKRLSQREYEVYAAVVSMADKGVPAEDVINYLRAVIAQNN